MNSRVVPCTLIFLVASCSFSFAQTPTAADLNALRAQIDALKADYDKRIQALETQLQALQGQTQSAPPAAAAIGAPGAPAPQQTVQVPPGAEGGGGPSGQLPVYGGAAAGS